MAKGGEECQEAVSRELALQIQRLSASLLNRHPADRAENEGEAGLRILAVGLGNHLVTPDSLGPETIGNLQMTRHLESQMGPGFCRERGLPVLSGIVPGVMAQTGMETAEILKGIISETKPPSGNYNPADRYRDSSGLGSGKPQAQPDGRKLGSSCSGNWRAYGSGGGGHCP